MLRRLHGLLTRRIALRRGRFGVRLVLEPAVRRARPLAVTPPRVPREAVPPMPAFQVRAARTDLAAILDAVPAARRVFPSLALLERALGTPGGDGIHRVEACVLRHAAQSLDQLGDDWFSPGLVVLRRRVELILRRRHGDAPTHSAQQSSPSPRHSDFMDTPTEFMDIDRPLRGHPPAFVGPRRLPEAR
jgi:hypothetical protein